MLVFTHLTQRKDYYSNKVDDIYKQIAARRKELGEGERSKYKSDVWMLMMTVLVTFLLCAIAFWVFAFPAEQVQGEVSGEAVVSYEAGKVEFRLVEEADGKFVLLVPEDEVRQLLGRGEKDVRERRTWRRRERRWRGSLRK